MSNKAKGETHIKNQKNNLDPNKLSLADLKSIYYDKMVMARKLQQELQGLEQFITQREQQEGDPQLNGVLTQAKPQEQDHARE